MKYYETKISHKTWILWGVVSALDEKEAKGKAIAEANKIESWDLSDPTIKFEIKESQNAFNLLRPILREKS